MRAAKRVRNGHRRAGAGRAGRRRAHQRHRGDVPAAVDAVDRLRRGHVRAAPGGAPVAGRDPRPAGRIGCATACTWPRWPTARTTSWPTSCAGPRERRVDPRRRVAGAGTGGRTDHRTAGGGALISSAAARHAWEGGEPPPGPAAAAQGARPLPTPHVSAQAELLLGEIELRAGATTHARQALLSAAGELGQDRHLAVTAMLRAGEALLLSGDYPRYEDVAQQGEGAAPIRRTDRNPAAVRAVRRHGGDVPGAATARPTQPLRRVVTLANDARRPGRVDPGHDVGDPARRRRAGVPAGRSARRRWPAPPATCRRVPLALELAAAAEFALGRYDVGHHDAAGGAAAGPGHRPGEPGQQHARPRWPCIAAFLGDRDDLPAAGARGPRPHAPATG